jgi:RHS repeat-associated protein
LDYVYQFKDHLGNIRLSYKDADKDGSISTSEIIQEKNYYPFGLQHKGYNFAINGRKHNYGYNGIEHEEGLGLNVYEMDLRQYDPAIARWTAIDPIDHVSQSTYNGFDNNPIYWADPSGAAVEEIEGGVRYTGEHAKLAFGALQKQYGGTDPKKKKKEKKKATVTTEDPVAYGIEGDNNRSDMPDFIKSADVGHYDTTFEGDTNAYNLRYGTDYVEGEQNYNKYYYDFHYRPRLSALRGSIQAAQGEAAEYISYILPLGGGVRGVMAASKGVSWLSKAYTKVGIRTHILGNKAFNFAKNSGYNALSSSIRNSSFAAKRNIVRFGGNRIKSSIQNFNSFNHDIMNVKVFNNAKQLYDIGKQASKFFK